MTCCLLCVSFQELISHSTGNLAGVGEKSRVLNLEEEAGESILIFELTIICKLKINDQMFMAEGK
jgi:hypothetical protein